MAQYTDQQMAAFSKIAYFEQLNDALQANGGKPVSLGDIRLTDGQKAELENIGFKYEDYKNWKIVDVYDTNDKNGFSCCTIETAPGKAAVAFRGSEGFDSDYGNVIHDWTEADIGLLNSVQTEQQAEVKKFLNSRKELLNQYDLGMTGHSLGGNLADYATIVSGRYGLSDNVQQCLSLDGPGFSDEFILTHAVEIARMRGKMEHVQWSVVGNMLNRLPLPIGNNRIGDVTNKDGLEEYNSASRHDMQYLKFNEDGSIAKGSMDPLAVIGGIVSQTVDHMPSFISNGLKAVAQGLVLIGGWIVNRDHVWEDIKKTIAARLGLNKTGKSGGGSGGGHGFGSSGANVIRVSTEEMAAAVAEYQNQKSRLMEALSSIENAARTLAQSWAGPSFLAMSAKLTSTYKNLRESVTKIDDAIDELKKTINTMEKAEKGIQSAMSSLETGTSPFL